MQSSPTPKTTPATLFLCGDVMTGRGIDQILLHPSEPHLYEPYVRSALGYVEIAEQATGRIERPAEFAYVWGDALAELERVRPDARIINLETAVTTAEDPWPGKGINYRMNPANVRCLLAAKIDCCVLANNHVLDWGHRGLAETLDTLRGAGLRTAGAGRNQAEAASPAAIDLPGNGRVLVFGFAMESSGVPPEWAAGEARAGVNFLSDLSGRTVQRIAAEVGAAKRAGDIVVLSIHWGGNWGYAVRSAERGFAHALIDAGVDVVHGHSSHHPRGIEVYRDRPILYGCGDFLNDYEGIRGHESFRPDLALMYLPVVDAGTGRLVRLTLTPMQIRHFRANRARREDARWLAELLSREGRALATRVDLQPDGTLALRWGVDRGAPP
ncbi:MAG TPA: CapA family protein [Burkholderiales bacterium]|nr:CapA family protein [Burkholderiales bacterium]